jgi:hypothetical protein
MTNEKKDIVINEKVNSFVTKNIKEFDAKGNGKTNDHEAFIKAAEYFNQRGGNGKLIIPKGEYIVGKQEKWTGEKGSPAYKGIDALHFSNLKNFELAGEDGVKFKYDKNLKYGSFDPKTGKSFNPEKKYFADYTYAAYLGHCIYLDNSENVRIFNIEIDGRNGALELGGSFGDVGRQLPHYGIFIKNSRDIVVDNVDAHHMALDGISISNAFKDNKSDNIILSNSKFEYNGRQGFSWIGGRGLLVKRCSFNHTGKAGVASPPGAGVDIEAEVGPITDGVFENCEFVNNSGCGMVADSGNSSKVSFNKCTFWGVTNWSVWVNKPGYNFNSCNIYGSFVHGFDATDKLSATKFKGCTFEDKEYKGKAPYGNFLVESNGRKRVSFEDCTFNSNRKKPIWIQGDGKWNPEEKYQLQNCTFIFESALYKPGDYVAMIRSVRYKNCIFIFKDPQAKYKKYYLNDCCGSLNIDLGGNEIKYK